MAFDEGRLPNPIFVSRAPSNNLVSTIVSTNTAGIASGSIIDVRDYTKITAFVDRGFSANAVELEASPDGSVWYNWITFAAGVALPAAGERASQESFVSGGTFSYVRGIPNVSATATQSVVVRLNALTK